jgi:hypothetical protein
MTKRSVPCRIEMLESAVNRTAGSIPVLDRSEFKDVYMPQRDREQLGIVDPRCEAIEQELLSPARLAELTRRF